jgi:hypothetical protein
MKRATVLFWLIIAFGVAVTPVVAIGAETVKGTPFVSAVGHWIGHLFEPGYNEFLLTLITAAPFIGIAVFSLVHLSGDPVPRGRWSGVAGMLCAGAALCLWGLIAIRMSRSSTASIGYFFLPIEVFFVMPVGYVVGRVVGKLISV